MIYILRGFCDPEGSDILYMGPDLKRVYDYAVYYIAKRNLFYDDILIEGVCLDVPIIESDKYIGDGRNIKTYFHYRVSTGIFAITYDFENNKIVNHNETKSEAQKTKDALNIAVGMVVGMKVCSQLNELALELFDDKSKK